MNAFIECAQRSLATMDTAAIADLIEELVRLRGRRGQLFCIGNGGGHSHASHAAADFRTLCGIEAYSFDNAPNLTALANDEGWDSAIAKWLLPTLRPMDAVLVISVGGGSESPPVSINIVNSLRLCRNLSTPILGVCGRDGGYTAKHAAACVLIPCDRPEWTTPITEGLQSVVLHMIVSDPRLAVKKAKWEGLTP